MFFNVSPVSHTFEKDGVKMFHKNDMGLYGTHGVCQIKDITMEKFTDKPKEYYVLEAADSASTKLFVPLDNEKLLHKMRKLLSEKEIYALIDSMPDEVPVWFNNETERKEQYKRILETGDHGELIGMIKAIYLHKQKRNATGKQLHISDSRFFKEAERILYNEFQYVLNIGQDELLSLIFSRIKK